MCCPERVSLAATQDKKSVFLAAQEVLNGTEIVQSIKDSLGRPVFFLMFLRTLQIIDFCSHLLMKSSSGTIEE